MTLREEQKNTLQLISLIIICLILFFFSAFLISELVNYGVDFNIYYESATLFWQGENPYNRGGYFNPPWLMFLMLPFLAFQPKYAFGLWTAISFVSIILAAKRMGIFRQRLWWLSIFSLIMSPPVFLCLLWGNIDLFLVYFCTVNNPISLFFLALKPHIYWPVILFRLVSWWRIGKRKTAFLTAVSLAIAYLISFAFYGFYILKGTSTITREFNTSLWPYGVLPGLLLLIPTYFSKRKNKLNTAMATGPLTSPQVTNNAWTVLFVSLCRHPILLSLLVSFYWALPFII